MMEKVFLIKRNDGTYFLSKTIEEDYNCVAEIYDNETAFKIIEELQKIKLRY